MTIRVAQSTLCEKRTPKNLSENSVKISETTLAANSSEELKQIV